MTWIPEFDNSKFHLTAWGGGVAFLLSARSSSSFSSDLAASAWVNFCWQDAFLYLVNCFVAFLDKTRPLCEFVSILADTLTEDLSNFSRVHSRRSGCLKGGGKESSRESGRKNERLGKRGEDMGFHFPSTFIPHSLPAYGKQSVRPRVKIWEHEQTSTLQHIASNTRISHILRALQN